MQLGRYPWLHESKKRIGKNLPPALLIHGLPGIGKHTLANHLAQSVLCEKVSDLTDPCGTCSSCLLFEVNTHPDFKRLTNDEAETSISDTRSSTTKKPKQVISVKSVRGLGDFCHTKPHRGIAKVVIIEPAENLNQSAANALLKNLEEPAVFLNFILLARHKESLIPTLLSRCLKVHAKAPDIDSTSQWLSKQKPNVNASEPIKQLAIHLSGSAPLAALELVDDDLFFNQRGEILSLLSQRYVDAFALAAYCEKIEVPVLQRVFYALLHDLLMIENQGQALFHIDKMRELGDIKRSSAAKSFCRWHSEFNEYLKSANHPLNRRLALEALFLKWPQTK
jgi:DNA polymerase-3 subunit delta'